MLTPESSQLGKKSTYDTHYDPSKLYPMPRAPKRQAIGIMSTLPFYGFDMWNHYEVSWLNEKGKPVAAIAEIIYGCDSAQIIESKSMKLYFNSFNNTHFNDLAAVETTIHHDLAQHLNTPLLTVKITPLSTCISEELAPRMSGINLDLLDISCDRYHNAAELLKTTSESVKETLCSDLLKSNCLVTNQPDWCSIQIDYQGQKINHEGLLQYFVSFRNDNEFHEQCIEKIFMHIMTHCKPDTLTVYGRSTRRGGLDINSCRSTHPITPEMVVKTRLCRQ